jgi:chromosome segregation ATPase
VNPAVHFLGCKLVSAVQEAIDQLVEEEDSLQHSLEELYSENKENAEKLKRKRAEFERMEQRLMQLKNVKAPYQDELDALEAELSAQYGVYLNKFRSLEYLEAELRKIHRWRSASAALDCVPFLCQITRNPLQHAETRCQKTQDAIADSGGWKRTLKVVHFDT